MKKLGRTIIFSSLRSVQKEQNLGRRGQFELDSGEKRRIWK